VAGGLLEHLSIRAPWHDTGWDGTVCRAPTANGACLVFAASRRKRSKQPRSSSQAGLSRTLTRPSVPPCVTERVGFMLARPFKLSRRHPYAKWSPAHQHLNPAVVSPPSVLGPAVCPSDGCCATTHPR